MDDSVIKVLRRNGSWQKTNKRQGTGLDSKKDFSKLKTYDEDFQLDEKFEILAKEIKKRMNQRGPKVSQHIKSQNNNAIENDKNISEPIFQDIEKLKSQILPYLKNIEQLMIRKRNHLNNIAEIDKELDGIYENISHIKNNYLDTINKLKNNMNFFDDSLDIIKSVKEEK